MEIFLGLVGAVISYVILYFVIKSAVRNGIIESRQSRDSDSNEDENNSISKTICPSCGKKHDIDYPKCPFCKHQY